MLNKKKIYQVRYLRQTYLCGSLSAIRDLIAQKEIPITTSQFHHLCFKMREKGEEVSQYDYFKIKPISMIVHKRK